uniref:FYVE-type domain-containing protein n=1 Tax=Phytophthora ramorum TaxID=164328 RepID=H3GZP8_PHYRM
MKGRFIVNPFQELNLTSGDRTSLVELANQCITSHLELCVKFIESKGRVDPNHWKPLKEKEKLKVYSERAEGAAAAAASGDEPTGSGLPMIFCVGTKEGKLDDLMYGVISEDLETMRMKASYVDDFSGAAVLDSVVLPTLEDPFQSLVIKWMELDIPFHSTNLVKNRDYVYLEGTGYVTSSRGERMGYHLLHSVNFPQTHHLPNRVRGNLSIIGVWRQIGSNTMEMWATGVMDPVDDGLVRRLVVPNMASLFLSSLKYAYCGQMRKLAFMLDKKYEESKLHGAPHRKSVCVTCSSPISGRKLGDFGKSSSTCKLCFGFVCHACKIVRKLSFVDPDLLLSQRKVTFCTACISEVTSMSSVDVARAYLLARKRHRDANSSADRALSSGGNSTDLSTSSH